MNVSDFAACNLSSQTAASSSRWHLPDGKRPMVIFLKHIRLPFRSKMGLDKEPGLIHLETSISEGRE